MWLAVLLSMTWLVVVLLLWVMCCAVWVVVERVWVYVVGGGRGLHRVRIVYGREGWSARCSCGWRRRPRAWESVDPVEVAAVSHLAHALARRGGGRRRHVVGSAGDLGGPAGL